MWLNVENIQEKDIDSTVISDLPDLPHLVGSGHSVGGVVSETVGASNVGENSPLQVNWYLLLILYNVLSLLYIVHVYISYYIITSLLASKNCFTM